MSGELVKTSQVIITLSHLPESLLIEVEGDDPGELLFALDALVTKISLEYEIPSPHNENFIEVMKATRVLSKGLFIELEAIIQMPSGEVS